MNPKLLFLGKPDEKDFHLLAQIMGVSPSGLEPLKQTAQVIEVAPGSQIYSHGKRYHDAMLLLAGSLESIDPDGTRHPIEAGQHTAGILPASQPASGQCISLTSARLFKADRAFLLALCHDKSLNTLTATTGSLEDFVANLRRVMITGHIEIPTLPDIGVKIARQIEDPKVDTLSLSRLIQMDPGLAGRIIQIANSPLFGGHGRIENLYDAVARLGRNTLRDVVTGIVLKNVFRTHEKDFRQRLKELWHHSTLTASLCQVLAQRIGMMDSGQAMLAGLLHDIGILPILHFAIQHPALINDPELLDQLVSSMRGECGQYALTHLGFSQSLIQAAMSAEDWWWESGKDQVELADLVILAQMHSYVGSRHFSSLPRFDQIPAFSKLGKFKVLSPHQSLKILDEASREITELQKILA